MALTWPTFCSMNIGGNESGKVLLRALMLKAERIEQRLIITAGRKADLGK